MSELKCNDTNGYFILRDGASGLFLASSLFPKSRETKKPAVADLKRHKDELDPKFHYFLSAPEKDSKGNPVLIRFSRKTREHFLMTEVDTKPTGWAAYWSGKQWEVKPLVE
jgi:DNA topoisomerase-1